MKMSKKGFTLVEIMIVVAIIGLLAAIAIPSFMRSREVAQANTCINNLRQIDSAKQQWAMAEGKTDAQAVAWNSTEMAEVNTYIRGGMPWCPLSDGESQAEAYDYTTVGTNAVCQMDQTTFDPRHRIGN